MIAAPRILIASLALLGAGAVAAVAGAVTGENRSEQKIATDCTPGVSFWSLLGSVSISYTSGQLQLDKLYAVCLPQPATPSESNYAYSPDQGGKLTTLLKGADGQVLTTYVWSAENISGLWELSNYKVLGGEQTIKPLAVGSYSLEFQIEGTPFQRFPFSVSTLPSDDPYQPPGTRWFIDGPWSEYGNVFYQRNDPQSSLRFTMWVEDKAGHPQQKSVPYATELLRMRDGAVIGRDESTLRADQHWRQLDVSFHLAGEESGSPMKAAAVLSDDGAYRVRFSLDGKTQGTYSFNVSGGKIQLQGRQLERTAPVDRIVDYLYGGRYRSWWVPRADGAAQIAK
jgi:hypothetical protein